MGAQSSDEAKVRQKWPEARLMKLPPNKWYVFSKTWGADMLGFGTTQKAAWADAARRLEREQ